MWLRWTNLVDAERGLQLLLGMDCGTMFTPQSVHDLKGAFGPFAAVFLQFWHEVIARKVVLPSSPAVCVLRQDINLLTGWENSWNKQQVAYESTWKSSGEIWWCSAALHGQVLHQLFETTVQTKKERKVGLLTSPEWLMVNNNIQRSPSCWLTADISAESTPLVCPWR